MKDKVYYDGDCYVCSIEINALRKKGVRSFPTAERHLIVSKLENHPTQDLDGRSQRRPKSSPFAKFLVKFSPTPCETKRM